MKINFKQFIIYLLCFYSFLIANVSGQVLSTLTSADLVKLDENSIFNGEKYLPKTIEKLKKKSTVNNNLSVLFIGDSHVKTPYMIQNFTLEMQKSFGEGGRFLIGKNGGFHGMWQKGGISVQANGNNLISSTKITFSSTSIEPDFSLSAGNGKTVITPVSTKKVKKTDVREFSFLPISNSYFLKPEGKYNLNFLESIKIDYPAGGISVSSYGIIGASVIYNATYPYFVRFPELSQPDLLVIWLGTNDAFFTDFSKKSFESYFRVLISKIQAVAPGTEILVMTPPDQFRIERGAYTPNANVEEVCDVIYSLSDVYNFAVYDLYKVMGGKGSIRTWFNNKLSAGDLIHLSYEGYLLTGELLSLAMSKLAK